MLSATVLRGCRRLRRRFPMPVAPTLLFRSFYPTNASPRPRGTSYLGTTSAAMKTSGGATSGVYVPPIPRRLRSVIRSANGTLSTARSVDCDWRDGVVQGVALGPTSSASTAPEADGYPPYLHQQSSHYARYAYEDYSDDESDRDTEPSSASNKGASTLENVDEWKWKLSMLLRNESEQELVSREKKDRRDFEHLATVADRMGLYSRQYTKVIVFSKVPLPNYRPDLDDKRPQREVSIPVGLHREVDSLLGDYLARKRKNSENFPSVGFSRTSSTDSFAAGESFLEQQDSQTSKSVVMEKILRRKSFQLRNQQQNWQESPEGEKMLEFRRNLPAYKEKEALLSAISQNQVVVVSGETGCGKTTQLPQYILESEIDAARGATCSIICTQPRRISAMAVSERVAAERGEKLGESVGYKVRLEGMKGRDTP